MSDPVVSTQNPAPQSGSAPTQQNPAQPSPTQPTLPQKTAYTPHTVLWDGLSAATWDGSPKVEKLEPDSLKTVISASTMTGKPGKEKVTTHYREWNVDLTTDGKHWDVDIKSFESTQKKFNSKPLFIRYVPDAKRTAKTESNLRFAPSTAKDAEQLLSQINAYIGHELRHSSVPYGEIDTKRVRNDEKKSGQAQVAWVYNTERVIEKDGGYVFEVRDTKHSKLVVKPIDGAAPDGQKRYHASVNQGDKTYPLGEFTVDPARIKTIVAAEGQGIEYALSRTIRR